MKIIQMNMKSNNKLFNKSHRLSVFLVLIIPFILFACKGTEVSNVADENQVTDQTQTEAQTEMNIETQECTRRIVSDGTICQRANARSESRFILDR